MHRGVPTMLTLVLTVLLAHASAGCAPPNPGAGGHHGPSGAGHHHPHGADPRPRVTDAFPDGTAQSAVAFWHDNPDLMPRILDGSTLLVDAAGSGASSVSVPTGPAREPLVLVLTCERPTAYSISLVAPESAEALTSTAGASCGGPSIALFTTPPLELSSTTAVLDVGVDVPSDTAYYLAVYRTSPDTILPTETSRLARSTHAFPDAPRP